MNRTEWEFVVNQTVGRGFIRLHAYPWAKVSIDGAPTGETPIDKAIELADGPHQVKFEHPFYVPVEKKVVVNGGTPDAATLVSTDFVKEKNREAATKFQKDDVIVYVDGQKGLVGEAGLLGYLIQKKGGESAEFTVLRGGKTEKIALTIP